MPSAHLPAAVATVALGLVASLLPLPAPDASGSGAGEVTVRAPVSDVIRQGDAPVAGFGWPLDPAPVVVRRFDAPDDPWGAGHRGVDLLGRRGQPVLAAGDGVVSFSGVIAGRGVVSVRHDGGWRTTYEPVTDRVPTGTRVSRGDRIGRLGPAGQGHCPPRACLHWGALAGPRDYRDPLALLGLVRPVLLPWSG